MKYRIENVTLAGGRTMRRLVIPEGATAAEISDAMNREGVSSSRREDATSGLPQARASVAKPPAATPRPVASPPFSNGLAAAVRSMSNGATVVPPPTGQDAAAPANLDDVSDVLALVRGTGLKGFVVAGESEPRDIIAAALAEDDPPAANGVSHDVAGMQELNPDDGSDIVAMATAFGIKGFGPAPS
jgi:hypothetical protein